MLAAAALLFIILHVMSRAGRAVMMRTGLDGETGGSLDDRIRQTALGLILLSLCILALGLFGIVSAAAYWALLGVFLLAGFLHDKKDFISFPKIEASQTSLFLGAFSAACLFLAWLGAAAPPTANDALVYHLYHPSEFIQMGRVAPIPYTRESLWPYLMETLYTLGLAVQGTALAQGFHWAFYGGTAAAIYSLARRLYGENAAWIAALCFLFTPAAFQEAGHAYVDLALGFFILVSLSAFILKKSGDETRSAVLSGIFMGAALSVKYLALGPAALLFIFWLTTRNKIKNTLLYALAAFAAGGVWYVRSWVITGNPFYPFFPGIFYNAISFSIDTGLGMPKTLLNFVLFPWNATFYPQFFANQLLGPLYISFLPALLIGLHKKAQTASKQLAIFAFFMMTLVFFQLQAVRFFLMFIPVCAIGVGVSAAHLMKEPFFKKPVTAVLGFVFALHLGIYGYHASKCVKAALGLESADAYLMRRERSYPGYKFLSETVKEGETLFNTADSRHFYSKTPGMVMDSMVFRHELKKQGKSITEYLNEKSFDYIFVEKLSDKEVLDFIEKGPYRVLHEYTLREGGHDFHYSVFKKGVEADVLALGDESVSSFSADYFDSAGFYNAGKPGADILWARNFLNSLRAGRLPKAVILGFSAKGYEGRRADLESLLQYCRDENIYAVGFLTGRSGHDADAARTLKESFNAKGFWFYDFTGEKMSFPPDKSQSLKLYLHMVSNDQKLQSISSTSRLEGLLTANDI